MKKYILGTLFFLAPFFIISQEIISSTGGISSGSGGTSSYTIGQVFYSRNTSIAGSVSQGAQQAFEIQTLSNNSLSSFHLEVITYPNPVTDYIVLKISNEVLKNLGYTLYDLAGKSIVNGTILSGSTQIQMKYLPKGFYILKIAKKNQSLKTFKIIKK